MPLLEFIIPHLKSDAVSQQTFRAQWPLWCKPLIHAPGSSGVHYGYMTSEDGVDVSSLMKLVISLKWNEQAEFNHFLAGEGFQTLVGNVKPYASAPTEVQLYESTAEGSTVFSDGITEVFRTSFSTEQKVAEVEKAWASFRDALQRDQDIKCLHGSSVNLAARRFVGAVGWRSFEARDGLYNDPVIAQAKRDLLNLEETSSFLVKMTPAQA